MPADVIATFMGKMPLFRNCTSAAYHMARRGISTGDSLSLVTE